MEFKESYFYLFNQITDMINKLKEIQVKAEELFLLQSGEEAEGIK